MIKEALIRKGPQHTLTRSTLRLWGKTKGFHVGVEDVVRIRQGGREVRLALKDWRVAPTICRSFDEWFGDFLNDGLLDFSRPAQHTHRRTGLTLWYPGIPEDDEHAEYTRHYTPAQDDIVYDVGAHAGSTAIWLASVARHVFAFEPDPKNFPFLETNVRTMGLNNVTLIQAAIGARTGKEHFSSDGSMMSSFADLAAEKRDVVPVDVLSMEDCFERYGVPRFVKMDIEGGELAALGQAPIAGKGIHFALDTHHIVGGDFTHRRVERIFRDAGYATESAQRAGLMWHTWGWPQ